MGSSRKDVIAFPERTRQEIGHALYLAQSGARAPGTKILKGFGGGGVVEIVEDHDGDTYRCVYTVRLEHAVYVLHAFKKKSKQGAKTPKHDLDLIRSRLQEAEERDRARVPSIDRHGRKEAVVTDGEDAKSAFHELGLPNPNERVVKSRLIRFVAEEIRRRELTQKEAGEMLGLDQPNVSALMNEKLSRFSVQKLMMLVGRLGFAVSIHVEGSGLSLDVPFQTAA